jgi:hypothetical protein
MAILSLVRFVCILYGVLCPHDLPDPHIYTISTDFVVAHHNIWTFNDTYSFHYFHKNP